LVYPIPGQDNITIELANVKTSDAILIDLVNISGTIVKSFDAKAALSNNKINIFIGDLPSGVYIIHCQSGDKKFTQKLSVIRQ
jgi:hypothetical protein